MGGPVVGGKLLGVGKREVEEERGEAGGQTPVAPLEGHPSLLPVPGGTQWTQVMVPLPRGQGGVGEGVKGCRVLGT